MHTYTTAEFLQEMPCQLPVYCVPVLSTLHGGVYVPHDVTTPPVGQPEFAVQLSPAPCDNSPDSVGGERRRVAQ